MTNLYQYDADDDDADDADDDGHARCRRVQVAFEYSGIKEFFLLFIIQTELFLVFS